MSDSDKALRIVLNVKELDTISNLRIENNILKKEIKKILEKFYKVERKCSDLFDYRGDNTLSDIINYNNDNYLKNIYGNNYKEEFNYEDNILLFIRYNLDPFINNFLHNEFPEFYGNS